MSLIESAISSVVFALLMSVLVGAALCFVKLKHNTDSLSQVYNRDFFIARSFEALSDGNFESWMTTCKGLYPNCTVHVRKLGEKNSAFLYVAEWDGRKTYLKIDKS